MTVQNDADVELVARAIHLARFEDECCTPGADDIAMARAAIAAWNTRAPNAAAEGLAKALEGAIPTLQADWEEGIDHGDADWEGMAFECLENAVAALAAYRAAYPS